MTVSLTNVQAQMLQDAIDLLVDSGKYASDAEAELLKVREQIETEINQRNLA